MGFRNLARRRVVIWVIVGALFLVLMRESAVEISDKKPKADAVHYMAMGYNLSEYGTLSLDKNDVSNPAPTAYREPGFPTYLALVRTIHPQLRKANLTTFLSSSKEVETLKYYLLLLVLITAIMAAYIVYEITKKEILAYFALLLVGLSNSLLNIANTLYAENLAALLVLGVAISLYQLFKTKKLIYFVFLGVSLGLLVLTKAVFLYFILFVTALLIFAFIKKLFSKQIFFAGISLFFLLYSLTAGAWMVRNYIQFNEFFISGRSGVILLIRAEYNKMNTKEFLGSFLIWTPGEFAEKTLYKFFGNNALEVGGELERLNRNNDPQSFYRSARNERTRLTKAYGLERENTAVNDELTNRAKRRILTHPFKHTLVTIPLLWQGLFVEDGLCLIDPIEIPVAINLLYFISFCFVTGLSLLKRKWSLFAFLLPAIFSFSMHSLFSNSIPRYNQPLIPIFVVSFLVALDYLVNNWKHKKFS